MITFYCYINLQDILDHVFKVYHTDDTKGD